jgi:hypothetical protein
MSIPCLRFGQRDANKEKISEIAVQRQEGSGKIRMTTILTLSIQPKVNALFVALAVSAALILPARAQDFGEHSRKPQFPVESHPRVSEKDYKAALEKIPTPTQKYDPWGGAHTNESQKGTADTARNARKTSPAN